MKVYLDANFFIFAGFDPAEKGQKARALLAGIINGHKEAITSTLALDEVMWVILKNKAGNVLRKHVEDIYRIPHLKVVTGSVLVPLRALDFIEKYHLKPRDAFHAAFMQEHNVNTIVSDDADFDKINGVKRIF